MGFKPWMMIGVKSDYAIDCATAAPYLPTYLPTFGLSVECDPN